MVTSWEERKEKSGGAWWEFLTMVFDGIQITRNTKKSYSNRAQNVKGSEVWNSTSLLELQVVLRTDQWQRKWKRWRWNQPQMPFYGVWICTLWARLNLWRWSFRERGVIGSHLYFKRSPCSSGKDNLEKGRLRARRWVKTHLQWSRWEPEAK